MEGNLWREVTHLWYLGWPEQGVPSEANSLIAFLIEARSQMKTQAGSAASGPAVVHCSPGKSLNPISKKIPSLNPKLIKFLPIYFRNGTDWYCDSLRSMYKRIRTN